MNENIPEVRQRPDSLNYRFVHGFNRTRYPRKAFPGDGFWYGPGQTKPWCVQRAYSGHYFDTLSEALKYAAARRFISYDMVDIIRVRLEERGFENE